MLVTVTDSATSDVLQEVNTDHVVNVATPNVNNPDKVTISLSNGRQITTNAEGAQSIRDAINGPQYGGRSVALHEPEPLPDTPTPMTPATGEGQQVGV